MASLGAAIALWLLLAAALGLGTGWLLWGWWANRPPADLPTDEELLRLRSDLELAREQVADLRAALAEAGVGTAAPTTRPAGTKRSAPPPPVTRPHDVTDSDGDWGSGAFLLAARAQELASLPDLQEHGRVGGGPTTAGSLRAVHGITVKVERALQRRGVRSLDQLAALSDEDVERLDAALGEFQGRIHRDDWVGQARRLLEPD